MNNDITTNELGELTDGDILELECPSNTVYAKVVNTCTSKNPAIFGVNREPELAIIRAGDSFDFNVSADDISVTFTPLGGYRMCALDNYSNATACGTDEFALNGVSDQDVIQLFCSVLTILHLSQSTHPGPQA